jgi:transposase InsO family protein
VLLGEAIVKHRNGCDDAFAVPLKALLILHIHLPMPTTNGATSPKNLPTAKDARHIHLLWSPTMQMEFLSNSQRLRKVAQLLKLSPNAKERLAWIIYYLENGRNASATAAAFGISRKTFHKWWREYDEDNPYTMTRLEDRSRAPQHVRQRQITFQQERRIIHLKRQFPRYGKTKLAMLYAKLHGSGISTWHIQQTIERFNLQYQPAKAERTAARRRRARGQHRKKLTELYHLADTKKKPGYIICLDTIALHKSDHKRYIFTAVDKYSKVAFARMYTTKSTKSAQDFLKRLYYLCDGQVPRVGHDNGSEFKLLFQQTCRKLSIEQYYSRVRTPKDNADNERFNRTLRDEFIQVHGYHRDPAVFNRKLTEWLIHYNFERPHQSLAYQTPMETAKVLPMCPSSTDA